MVSNLIHLGTFFAQAEYTDPYLVTQWYANGHEVADHSFTHGGAVPAGNPNPFTGSFSEIMGTLNWFNQYAGIPSGQIKGVRFPFRNYTAESLANIRQWGFTYDSSMSVPPGEDTSIWPYTLDHGVVSECTDRTNLPSLCNRNINIKGLWEIPMYSIAGSKGVHLMDVYNDYGITGAETTATLWSGFQEHYNGNRAPFGVYTHPNWMTSGVSPNGAANLKAVQDFLDRAMERPDVWMVTGSQLIEYMRNPVSAADLANQPYMRCVYKPTPNICNGGQQAQGVRNCPGLDTIFNVRYFNFILMYRLASIVHHQDLQFEIQLLNLHQLIDVVFQLHAI